MERTFTRGDIEALIYFVGIQFDFYMEKTIGLESDIPFSAILLQYGAYRHAAFAGVKDEILEIIADVMAEQTARIQDTF